MNIRIQLVGESLEPLGPQGSAIGVRSEVASRNGLADVVVFVDGHEVAALRSFADARVLDMANAPGGGKRRVGAALSFANCPNGTTLLLGVMHVVAIDVVERKVSNVFERFRAEEDDHGFYREELRTFEHGLLVIYEGGVACLSDELRLLWHVSVTWNDLPGDIAGGVLFFSRESQSGTLVQWGISLADGRAQGRPS